MEKKFITNEYKNTDEINMNNSIPPKPKWKDYSDKKKYLKDYKNWMKQYDDVYKEKYTSYWKEYSIKPEVKNKKNEYFKKRYHGDAEFRKKHIATMSERQYRLYHTDAEFRASHLKKCRDNNKKRYHTDPQFREKCLSKKKILYQTKKQNKTD